MGAFKEALLYAYGGRPKSRGLCNFDQCITSGKTHRGATKAFQEFERRFTRVPKREQRLVGMDNVLLFIRLIDRVEREAIGIELEDNNRANGLTEHWSKVE